MLPADVAPIEDAVDKLVERLYAFEERLERYAAQAAAKGHTGHVPSRRDLWSAINQIVQSGKGKPFPGTSNAHILGRFYVKQVDVVVSSWEHGPDVLVSTKTQFSSYGNNKNNRYEEAVGEVTNLRDRHPMAAMGFVFLVRTNVYDEEGAFAYLRDLLVRLRKPDGAFDATMLLAADWDDETLTLKDVKSATSVLSAEQFFRDLVRAVTTNTPVDQHVSVRDLLPEEEPLGGWPSEEDALVDDSSLPDEGDPVEVAERMAETGQIALDGLREDRDG